MNLYIENHSNLRFTKIIFVINPNKNRVNEKNYRKEDYYEICFRNITMDILILQKHFHVKSGT